MKHTANVIRLWTFCAVITIIVVSTLYAHYITRLSIQVNNIEIASTRVPKAFDGFRIAHISDFHIDSFDDHKEFVDEIVNSILDEQPDIVCFSGDIVTMRSAQLIPYRKSLARLASTGIPVYFVMGNHDYADYAWRLDEARKIQDRDSLRLMIKEIGWQQLDNTKMPSAEVQTALSLRELKTSENRLSRSMAICQKPWKAISTLRHSPYCSAITRHIGAVRYCQRVASTSCLPDTPTPCSSASSDGVHPSGSIPTTKACTPKAISIFMSTPVSAAQAFRSVMALSLKLRYSA